MICTKFLDCQSLWPILFQLVASVLSPISEPIKIRISIVWLLFLVPVKQEIMIDFELE